MISEKLLQRLSHASGITILTGSGISAESGAPTFQNTDGLWNSYKIEELTTLKALNANPELFWKFYTWRRQKLQDIEPNLGHYALVDLERIIHGFALLTQNVDNLHRIAGSKKLIELYGNLTRDRCTKCGQRYPAETGEFKIVPTCTKCDGLLRPDVVLSGEEIEEKFIQAAQKASAACEVFLSIGSSSVVEPTASLPYLAKANGAYVIEVNTEETPLTSHVNEVYNETSSVFLPQLAIALEKKTP
jgi:NAD-dependent deacetylase